MYRSNSLVFIVLATLTMLTGCGLDSKQVQFHPSKRKMINTIALVRPENPPRLAIVDDFAEDIGSVFGVIGWAIGAGIGGDYTERRTKQFAEGISDIPFDFRGLLSQAIYKTLTDAGYTVKFVNANKQKEDEFLASYNHLNVKADAYLDMAVYVVGFINEPDLLKFVPRISLNTQLVSSDGSETYYRHWYYYGPSGTPGIFYGGHDREHKNPKHISEADILPSPPEYHFADFDKLFVDRKQAIRGLKAGIERIAGEIGDDLTAYDSMVYIYRPNIFMTDTSVLSIAVDEHELGRLENDGHFVVSLSPGQHVITVVGCKVPDIVKKFNVKPENTYYLKIEIPYEFHKGWEHLASKCNPKVTFVPENVGQMEVHKTKELLLDR